MTPPQVHEFAKLVTVFREWVFHSKSDGSDAAMEAVKHLLDLYRAALELPMSAPASGKKTPEVEHAEWRVVVQNIGKRLPVGYYGEIFNPLQVPSEEPVIGDVSDDIGDIYRDLVNGLLAYEQGEIDEAIWRWKFALRNHWGNHATSTIRTLHWWLAENYQFGI
jgi:hypothetical protein